MLISSMGRYAVLILLDLAEHRGDFITARQTARCPASAQMRSSRAARLPPACPPSGSGSTNRSPPASILSPSPA